MPEATKFRLWLHLSRLRVQRAAEYQLGAAAASGRMRPDRSWFEALAPVEEEAEAMYQRAKLSRETAAARARLGLRGD